jgi:hypothetical protein
LWDLVDQRYARFSTPHGRLDERMVAATQAAIAAETPRSTGDRARRLRRAVKAILDERHGVDAVALPAETTFYRVLKTMTAGRYTFGDAHCGAPPRCNPRARSPRPWRLGRGRSCSWTPRRWT